MYGNLDVTTKVDKEIDENITNNIVSTALNETGGLGSPFQASIEQGDMDVSITNYSINQYTDDEALKRYLIEQENRNELVNDVINIIAAAKNPAELIAFFVNKAADGNSFSKAAMDELFEELPSPENALKSGLLDLIEEGVINEFFNAIDSIHHDTDKIASGEYIDAEIVLSPINPIEGNSSTHLETYITTVRLIEQDGEYVFDPDNPLCVIAPETY